MSTSLSEKGKDGVEVRARMSFEALSWSSLRGGDYFRISIPAIPSTDVVPSWLATAGVTSFCDPLWIRSSETLVPTFCVASLF